MASLWSVGSFGLVSSTASATGVGCAHDGNSNQVKKSNGKLHWFGIRGEVLAESDLCDSIASEYVYWKVRHIARKDPASSSVRYFVADQLGSVRQIVTVNLNVMVNGIVAESDYYPYGGERVLTADSSNNAYKFTGNERDCEAGLDHTLNR